MKGIRSDAVWIRPNASPHSNSRHRKVNLIASLA